MAGIIGLNPFPVSYNLVEQFFCVACEVLTWGKSETGHLHKEAVSGPSIICTFEFVLFVQLRKFELMLCTLC
jgi:hypothetical protein